MKAKSASILRMLEYRGLSTLDIAGKILDLGGSTKSGYDVFFKEGSHVDTVNLDTTAGANIIANVEEILPIDNDTYDHVIALNLIEHVYKVQNVFIESYRVLKSNGTFIVAVPFMHHVHASPDDYHRYTASSLRRMSEDAGFKVVEIRELGGGLFSIWFQMIGGAIRPSVLRNVCRDICCSIDSFLSSWSRQYARMVKNNPLGYLLVVKK